MSKICKRWQVRETFSILYVLHPIPHFPMYVQSTKLSMIIHDRLPETSIASQNRPSQKDIHLPTIDFQGLLPLVSGFGHKNSMEQIHRFWRCVSTHAAMWAKFGSGSWPEQSMHHDCSIWVFPKIGVSQNGWWKFHGKPTLLKQMDGFWGG